MRNKATGQNLIVNGCVWAGRTRTSENIERHPAARPASDRSQGARHPTNQEVVCLETGKLYDYVRAAAEAVKGSAAGIREACNTGSECGGRHWMFAQEWESLQRPKRHPRTEELKSREWRVVRLSDGKVYRSAPFAARDNGVTAKSIVAALDNPSRSAARHYWMRETTWLAQGKPIHRFEDSRRLGSEVVAVTTGTMSESATACAHAVGLTSEAVTNVLEPKTESARFMDREDPGKSGRPERRPKLGRRATRVRDCQTGKVFDSISAAAKSIGGTAGGLRVALKRDGMYRKRQFERVDADAR